MHPVIYGFALKLEEKGPYKQGSISPHPEGVQKEAAPDRTPSAGRAQTHSTLWPSGQGPSRQELQEPGPVSGPAGVLQSGANDFIESLIVGNTKRIHVDPSEYPGSPTPFPELGCHRHDRDRPSCLLTAGWPTVLLARMQPKGNDAQGSVGSCPEWEGECVQHILPPRPSAVLKQEKPGRAAGRAHGNRRPKPGVGGMRGLV